MLRWLWPESVYLRSIRLMGAVIAGSTYAVDVLFFVREASVVIAEGILFFVFDFIVRLGGGIPIAFLTYLPYYVASSAVQKTGYGPLFAVLTLFIFIAHVWLSINAVFFPQGSTSSVGLLFFPIYLALPLLVIWGFVHVLSSQKGDTQ
jgi:hypothetical protein